jgi:hypothetical protein
VALPDGFEEAVGEEDELDENGEPKARKEVIYIAGRVYKEEVNPKNKKPYAYPKWIYERYNQVVTSEKFPQIEKSLANLYRSSVYEVKEYENQIQ